ncbi:MAG: exo-rhamnogalacturonan lyase family protein [Planctomycetota bacterium]|jgi:hypothetical protein
MRVTRSAPTTAFLAAAACLLAGCVPPSSGRPGSRPGKPTGYAGALNIELRETAGVERVAEPVRVGLPMPAGALVSPENVRVVLSDGREMPSQSRAAARCTDGSVRWLELLFQPSVAANAVGRYRVEFGPKVRRGKVEKPLTAASKGGTITVDTGRLRLTVGEGDGRLSCWFDRDADGKYGAKEQVVGGSGLKSFVELKALRPGAASGRLSSRQAARLEEAGPLRAVVALGGHHPGAGGAETCPFVLRVYAYRGKSFLRLVRTMVVSEPAAASRIMESGVSLGFPGEGVHLPARQLRQEVTGRKRYPDLAGFKPAFRLLEDKKLLEKGAERGFVQIDARRFLLSAVVPGAAESAPWEIRSEPEARSVTAAFWPRWGAEHTDGRSPDQRGEHGFKEFTRTESYERYWQAASADHGVGASRTHEMWIQFDAPGAGREAAADLASRADAPLVAWPGAEWLARSGAFGRLHFAEAPAGGADGRDRLELGMARLGAWLRLHQRQKYGWLGFWDFGDYQTIYRRRRGLDIGERWWNWHGRWGWMQGRGGLASALLVPWLERGEAEDWERFRACVVHNLDVDTVHAAGRGSGAAGLTHGPGATHWSGAPQLRWTYPAAWLDYYYLAGEPRVLEAVRSLVGSLGDKTVGDFGKPDVPWTPDQAGYLRARLAAHEILGEDAAKAARAALNHFVDLSARELGGRSDFARELAPALIRYHRLTGDRGAAAVIERGTRYYISSRGPGARGGVIARNCFDACAYAWRISGERYFLERGRQLVERSAAARAADREVAAEAEPPADLTEDSRAVFELGTIPYLRAALREAEAAD